METQIAFLIKLLPCSTFSFSPILCRTYLAELDRLPKFTALDEPPESISDGNETPIELNGNVFSVPSAVHKALEQLRYVDEPRYILPGGVLGRETGMYRNNHILRQIIDRAEFIAAWDYCRCGNREAGFKIYPTPSHHKIIEWPSCKPPKTLVLLRPSRDPNAIIDCKTVNILPSGYPRFTIVFKDSTLTETNICNTNTHNIMVFQDNRINEIRSSTLDSSIKLDGQQVRVHQTTADTLRELRRSVERYLFWVPSSVERISPRSLTANIDYVVSIIGMSFGPRFPSGKATVYYRPLAMAQNAAFQYYRPLSLSEAYESIRLLGLPSRKEQPLTQAEPQYRLHHISLNDLNVPEYTVLKFLGPKTLKRNETAQIIIDRHLFLGPSHLGKALEQCRSDDRSTYLWVDFICCNQLDTQEVRHHYRLLKRIQSQALSVKLERASIMVTDFQYCRLNPQKQEIRILVLSPNNGSLDSPVRGRLVTRSLENRPNYLCLSYTWGKQDSKKSISLDGYRFPVGENLSSALHQIRRRDEEIKIWIDAICINQNDIPERNSQVEMMGQIYSAAKKVLVWLGPAAEDSDLVIDFWQDLGKDELSLEIGPHDWGRIFDSYITVGRKRNSELQTVVDQLLDTYSVRILPAFGCLKEAIKCMDSRSWWKRLWVFQEVVLASDLELLCGTKRINWEVFDRAQQIIQLWLLKINNDMDNDMKNIGRPHISPVSSNLRDYRVRWHKSIWESVDKLLWTLGSLSGRDASEDRDRVYAPLALIRDEIPSLKPDYDKSTIDVYIDLAIALAKRTGHFVFLYRSGASPKPLLGIPSWVPRWDLPEIPDLRMDRKSPSIFDPLQKNDDSIQFYACGDCPAIYNLISNRRVLVLHGVEVDTISVALQPIPDSLINSSAYYETFDKWETATWDAYDEREQYVGGGDLVTAFMSTIFDYVLEVESATVEEHVYNFMAWKRYRNRTNVAPASANAPDFIDSIPLRLLSAISKNLIFFLTRRGFIGTCMDREGVEPGARVVVVKGGTKPIILKKVLNGEVFIAEAYVHGLMYGEAMKGLREGQYKLQEFPLV